MKSPIPPARQFRGFKRPDSTSLPEILIGHAKENSQHPLFRYVDLDETLKIVLWAEAVQAFRIVAQSVRRRIGDACDKPTVAIIGSFDHITYFSLIGGMILAGYPVFPISPRNTPPAIAHLLHSAGCTHVIVEADLTTQGETADNLISAIGNIIKIPAPSFEDIFIGSQTDLEHVPIPSPKEEDVVVILHSSGSVAFPKVTKVSHHYGEIDVCGQIWSAHNLPPFHFAGVMELVWATFSGITLAVFPPTSPPIIPTPARVFDEAVATRTTLMYCVPSFLEIWAREPDRLAPLKQFKSVMFAGAPLQPAVGDFLSENGVKLSHIYGLTETGGLSMMIPEHPPKEGWNYFHLAPHIDPVLVPVAELPGVYRLIVKKCATHTPAILNTTVDGVPALDTNGLLVRHSQNNKLWTVYGREADDQIMHSNGEKTNPGPLEAIILNDPAVKHAVMFGRGKFNAGVLIFPTEPFDPADTELVAEFRRRIWPSIEEANQYAPAHSRVFKEMILVADPLRPIELTAKGTPRRQAAIEAYRHEIQAIYDSVEASSLTYLVGPEQFNPASSINFVREVVTEVMIKAPGDEEDILQHGCDSLQATWIRNSLLHALRRSQIAGLAEIPHDFVYSHPNIRLLALYLVQLASGLPPPSFTQTQRILAMTEMVRKYTQEFPPRFSDVEAPTEEVVLVTGTTGALGSYLLAHLLLHPEFTAVYALNRPGGSIRERQRASFLNHGIDDDLLNSPKLHLLEGDLTQSAFGLAASDFGGMRSRVTCIIHNAWQVDFNFSLSSFEPGVQGTRNLVDFALTAPYSKPPQFLFISTLGVYRSTSLGLVAPESRITGANTSSGQGYAESKWVCEQILETAAETTLLRPVIVRAGQLSGGIAGAWKTSEWFPTLLRSSQLLGQLPQMSGRISWLPIHHAAAAVSEMRRSKERYLHLSHPHPVPFAELLTPIATDLGLPIVPYAQWLDSLKVAAARGLDNPGVRLLDFFGAVPAVSEEGETFFPVPFANANALENSPFLTSITPLDRQDANAWMSYLRKVGYLT
ncbi:hypothetical protein C8R46DRAFT_901759 [Mycena filopes]|nr:hypothetical protein C8R46DRAFT_901759 [Mycena filopes]